MKRSARAGLFGLVVFSQVVRADISQELGEATKPLNEGIPEVGVFRLQALLKQRLSEADWRAVAEKTAEALVRANRTTDAFNLLADPRLQESISAKFWRAQLLANLHRESEALPLYQEAARDQNPSL